jgi:hypothetical protein
MEYRQCKYLLLEKEFSSKASIDRVALPSNTMLLLALRITVW